MTLTPLGQAICNLPLVENLRTSLARQSSLQDFPAVRGESPDEPAGWERALGLASVLAGEDDESAQDFALRVAQGVLRDSAARAHEREAAVVLLERMGNRPSIELAVSRKQAAPESWAQAPAPLALAVVRRRLELSIPLSDGSTIAANPFQRLLALESTQWISVSAPTSAGKSYLVRRWFEERLSSQRRFTGVYVVPTRALIDEVSRDLRAELNADDVGIYTIPWDAEIDERDRKVLVMTQERLHLLQQHLPHEMSDLIFVDEAQKFSDGVRGVLLQQTIEEAVRRNPSAQVLFASPLTSNPEVLLEEASPASQEVVKSRTITVAQNLLWADQLRGKPTEWQLQIVLSGQPSQVGTFSLANRPTSESKRLSLVAVALGEGSGGNVVYVNGAADAEKIAIQIFDALGPGADANEKTIDDLCELVQKTIHPRYALAHVLRRRVAFHYGNMPLLVRAEIERLFRDGVLSYLVCTSTLLEGVNLPCRNLFARNPKKGKGSPMKAADFWNLAGRAGRWGKEFEGNIVCVDATKSKVWPEAPWIRDRQPMTRITTETLRDADRLIAYIESGAPASAVAENPVLETVFSYLAARWVKGLSFSELSGIEHDEAEVLSQVVGQAIGATEITPNMIERHPGISPTAMQRLLDRFRMLQANEQMTLVLPESYDAVDNYLQALDLCDEELGSGFGEEKRRYAVALLITLWMRGLPLARLITYRLDYLRRMSREIKLPKEIRLVMSDVEQIARFKAPKYLACYSDVLTLHLRQTGRPDVAPDISMMLELGVSRTTEVSLMSLGLSRTSAVAVGELIVSDDLSRDEVLAWLRDHADLLLSLPALVQRDIESARHH